MFAGLLHRLDCFVDVLIDAVQQTPLLYNQSLQIPINRVETVYRFKDLADLLVSLLHHSLLHVFELLL